MSIGVPNPSKRLWMKSAAALAATTVAAPLISFFPEPAEAGQYIRENGPIINSKVLEWDDYWQELGKNENPTVIDARVTGDMQEGQDGIFRVRYGENLERSHRLFNPKQNKDSNNQYGIPANRVQYNHLEKDPDFKWVDDASEQEFAKLINQKGRVYMFCYGNVRAPILAAKMREAGFEDEIYFLKGGLSAGEVELPELLKEKQASLELR